MSEKKYSIVLAGVDRLSMTFRETSKESEKLKNALKAQESAVRDLDRQQSAVNGYQKQRAALSSMGAELSQARARVESLSAEIAASTAPTKAQARAMAQAKKEVEVLSSAFERQRGKVRASVDAMREADIKVDKLGNEQRRLKTNTEAANAALDVQRTRLKALASAQTRVDAANARLADVKGQAIDTAATVAAVAVPVVRAVAAESAMSDVAKVVDFSSDDEKQNFKNELAIQAAQNNMSFSEAAAISAAAGSSGIKGTDEIMRFTKSAAKMAVAFDMAAADAGASMSAWRQSMALDQDGAEKLGNAINFITNNIGGKASALSGVMQRQGATALASGLNPEQGAALAGAMLSTGSSEEVAATTMKNLLGALTRGKSATKSQREAVESLGFDSEQLAEDMQSAPIKTIQSVFKAISEAPIEEQSALVSQLFGDESKGGIMPLLKNMALLDKSFSLVADSSKYSTAMLDEAAVKAATSGNAFGRAGQGLDALVTTVGESLLPVLGPAASGFADATVSLTKFAQEHQGLTAVVAGGMAALAAYSVAKLAYLYVTAKAEQWRAKGELSQAKLAAAEVNTAVGANRAAAALTRLNAVLASTARAGAANAAGGVAGGLGDVIDGDGKGRGGKAGKKGRLGKLGKLKGGGAIGGAVVAGATLLPLLTGGDDEKVGGEDIGAAAGGLLGGAGGWMAGAAAGAALGSVVPVIGTAVGGIVGGLLGGYLGGSAGDALGGKAGGWIEDKLKTPDVLSGAPPKNITYSPSIKFDQLPPQINAQQIVQMVIERQRADILPLLSGGSLVGLGSMEVAG